MPHVSHLHSQLTSILSLLRGLFTSAVQVSALCVEENKMTNNSFTLLLVAFFNEIIPCLRNDCCLITLHGGDLQASKNAKEKQHHHGCGEKNWYYEAVAEQGGRPSLELSPGTVWSLTNTLGTRQAAPRPHTFTRASSSSPGRHVLTKHLHITRHFYVSRELHYQIPSSSSRHVLTRHLHLTRQLHYQAPWSPGKHHHQRHLNHQARGSPNISLNDV